MIVARAKKLVARVLFERGGIETSGTVSASDLGLEGRIGYMPTPWRGLKRVFKRIAIGPEDVFLDVGFGKGRVVLEAARHPFRRVVGIELSPELHRIAEENLERSRRRLRCKDVSLVQGDVFEWPIPDDVTVVFLFNPFAAELFAALAQRLADSVARRPRTLRVVYVNPQEHEALRAVGARHVAWIWGAGGPDPEAISHSIGLYELGP